MDDYSKKEVAERVEISVRKVRFLTDELIILPDIVPKSGRGVERRYSDRNLIEFGMVEEFTQYGVPLNLSSIILASLRVGFSQHPPAKRGDPWPPPIDFSDFYENRSWGDRRELLFLTGTISFSKKQEYPTWFEIVLRKGSQFPFKFDKNILVRAGQENNPVNTFLWLGRIKKAACIRLGLDD